MNTSSREGESSPYGCADTPLEDDLLFDESSTARTEKSSPLSPRSAVREQPSAHDRAIMLLAPREHSVFELKRKLKTHEYAEAEINDAIEQLQQENLQSDERFCDIFVRSRVSRGQGPIKIEAGLRERGVSPAMIAMALEGAEVAWQALALEVLAKKFRQPATSLKDKSKQLRFLASRGFSAEQGYAALEQLQESESNP